MSPDGRLLATCSVDRTAKLRRVADGVCIEAFAGHIDFVMSVAFSPDRTLLAASINDKITKLWRVADGACIAILADDIDF